MKKYCHSFCYDIDDERLRTHVSRLTSAEFRRVPFMNHATLRDMTKEWMAMSKIRGRRTKLVRTRHPASNRSISVAIDKKDGMRMVPLTLSQDHGDCVMEGVVTQSKQGRWIFVAHSLQLILGQRFDAFWMEASGVLLASDFRFSEGDCFNVKWQPRFKVDCFKEAIQSKKYFVDGIVFKHGERVMKWKKKKNIRGAFRMIAKQHSSREVKLKLLTKEGTCVLERVISVWDYLHLIVGSRPLVNCSFDHEWTIRGLCVDDVNADDDNECKRTKSASTHPVSLDKIQSHFL